MAQIAKVLDLSHHNDVRSFEQIANSGVLGVILKCTEGASYVDPTYAERVKMAKEVGLLVGAYHFLRPGDMKNNAEHFLDNCGTDPGILLAADHEDPEVSLDDLATFLSFTRSATNQYPLIYSGRVLKEQIGNDTTSQVAVELARYRLWLAHYTTGTPTWPPNWDHWWLWQFTDQWLQDGVNGYTDGNKISVPADVLSDVWISHVATPPQPEPVPPEQPQVITIKITIPAGADVVISKG